MRLDDATLVRRLFARARELAGGEARLAGKCEELTGQSYSRQAVNAWIIGRNDPPTALTFAVARHYKLSLDELFLEEDERRTLQEQIRELHDHLGIVQAHVDRLLALQGQPPMEFPEAAAQD
jgi:hypothetical protein